MDMQIDKPQKRDKNVWCCGIDGIPSPRFFKALSDPTRLNIMLYLAGLREPRTVSQVAENFPIDLSVVSRHLSALKEAGALLSEKTGKEVLYTVDYVFLAEMFKGMAEAMESCCPSSQE